MAQDLTIVDVKSAYLQFCVYNKVGIPPGKLQVQIILFVSVGIWTEFFTKNQIKMSLSIDLLR